MCMFVVLTPLCKNFTYLLQFSTHIRIYQSSWVKNGEFYTYETDWNLPFLDLKREDYPWSKCTFDAMNIHSNFQPKFTLIFFSQNRAILPFFTQLDVFERKAWYFFNLDLIWSIYWNFEPLKTKPLTLQISLKESSWFESTFF